MHRRDFIQASIAATLLPVAAVRAAHDGASLTEHVFFDERFPLAREHAGRVAPGHVLTPVRGDATSVWLERPRPDWHAPVGLRGVTTESFWFCLAVLLGVHGGPDTRIVRLDRDLHLWSIRAGGSR